MNKKFKFFLKVLYYILTFVLGFLMALVLPSQYKYQALAKEMNQTIENREFVDAMDLVGGFYDSEIAYQNDNLGEDKGLVIFRAATMIDQRGVEGAKQSNIIRSVYAGYLYGVSDFLNVTEKDKTNKTILKVSDETTSIDVELLNYDKDEDKKNDRIVTLMKDDYIYFELVQNEMTSLTSILNLDFIDRNGDSYLKVSDLNLTYDKTFFTGVVPFIERYNDGLVDENKNADLTRLQEEFFKLSDTFKMGGSYYSTAASIGMKKAMIFVAIYFIMVYVLADFLLGKHYIFRGCRFIYRKIRYHGKELPAPEAPIYGTDYFTQLTYKLIVPEGFNKNVTIKYSNENSDLNMLFSKDNGYSSKQRIHAGTYQNAWLECAGYEAINIPKKLDVKGYTMEVKVTLQEKSDTQ